MTGFFIKKAFFDGWDNMVGMVLLNLGFLGILLLMLLSFSLVETSSILMLLALVVLLFLNAVYSGACSNACYGYSNYKRNTWNDFRDGFARYFRHSLLYFLYTLVLSTLILYVIPFYFAMNNLVGTLISVILVWVVLFSALALPYYFALSSYLPGDRPLKTLKKCFIILADNSGFSFFFLIYNMICLMLTFFTLGLIPGFAGMNIASHDAIKLMMLKYDYLEENPDADRKHLPWEDILYEEKEKVGPRSFKNMIFPWK